MPDQWIVIGSFDQPDEAAFYRWAIEAQGIAARTAAASPAGGAAATHLLVLPGDAQRARRALRQHGGQAVAGAEGDGFP